MDAKPCELDASTCSITLVEDCDCLAITLRGDLELSFAGPYPHDPCGYVPPAIDSDCPCQSQP